MQVYDTVYDLRLYTCKSAILSYGFYGSPNQTVHKSCVWFTMLACTRINLQLIVLVSMSDCTCVNLSIYCTAAGVILRGFTFCSLVCLENCVTQTASEYNAFKEKEIRIILKQVTSPVWVFSLCLNIVCGCCFIHVFVDGGKFKYCLNCLTSHDGTSQPRNL